ncbi:alpha-glucuronidase [Bogoriella caseilytica]|uniref:Alpha-glucuronidase n=1 Tax=Bogoriella caseilytica TaxID=56055 RepID=A0A3N2BCU2_9MICO|nr:alpha-glucuronidase [Bogoriella caseilytica]ROR73071.1 alpha-glucuronidase [Bogoriella caseilytica]
MTSQNYPWPALPSGADPAWLPPAPERGSLRLKLAGVGPLIDTVRAELAELTGAGAGQLVDGTAEADVVFTTADRADELASGDLAGFDVESAEGLSQEGFAVLRQAGRVAVVGGSDRGLLYGYHHWRRQLRNGTAADGPEAEIHAPATAIRMLNHWDNMAVHPVMGQVERGYSGGSLFYADGALREDLTRVHHYARLLASTGINRVALNNVNVGPLEATLLTERLGDVVRLAEIFRAQGIAVHLSVNFSSPMLLGGLPSADPADPDVAQWWSRTADAIYAEIPDFGGFLVKADSEGQPGPYRYGRDHAEGANMLARAVAPHGGLVFWRAFVYNHQQDWRDRSTDRARAAFDHFVPLDGGFDENVILQVKYGPMDFQVREPVSPVIGAMPGTRLAAEFQVTQEYTGQQKHACYLAPLWSQVLGFDFEGEDVGGGESRRVSGLVDAVVAVSNVGADEHWCGHPFAQANLFAFGRLAWDPALAPEDILREWVQSTYDDVELRDVVVELLRDSWQTYEDYTAPLGVGWMVRPGQHYGPDVDGYEYTPWGTYHFADREGIGVDRTVATGTGFTGQYPLPWAARYEQLDSCPDELLLFFHHVPYTHRLGSGETVIQHIYDTHFAGVERVEEMVAAWETVRHRAPAPVAQRVSERFAEQLRSAVEWRDQLTTYFSRKSGVADEHGRHIHP